MKRIEIQNDLQLSLQIYTYYNIFAVLLYFNVRKRGQIFNLGHITRLLYHTFIIKSKSSIAAFTAPTIEVSDIIGSSTHGFGGIATTYTIEVSDI
ncbi:MAG: hypothetical protein RSD78_08370, partial [Oscillospiraceae bacterium]